jgi:molecular chaperone GrpE
MNNQSRLKSAHMSDVLSPLTEQLPTPETDGPSQQAAAPAEAAGVLTLSKEQVEASEPYQQLNNTYLRLAADFENYRKRTLTEQDNLRKYGAEQAVKALLGALDNIDRGTSTLTEQSDSSTLYKSLKMLQQEIITSLNQFGLSRLQVSGQPFDPNLHEAITRQPSDTIPEDHVIMDVQAGYLLHDRVIRPALVSVSTGQAADSTGDD